MFRFYPILSLLRSSRDKSITRWYIAARVYEDIKIV